ncbi:hypothetical protein D3C80_1599770 [compost metagenome]
MDTQQIGQHHSQTRHYHVHREQIWGRKQKRKFDLLRHPGQKANQCGTQKSLLDLRLQILTRLLDDGQCNCRERKHHNRKQPGHKYACSRVTCKKTRQIPLHDCTAVRSGKAAKLKPEHIIQDMMEPEGCKHPVQHPVYEHAVPAGRLYIAEQMVKHIL